MNAPTWRCSVSGGQIQEMKSKLADSRAAPTLLSLRHDPRVLKLPPYLSLLCILIGVGWLLLLPLNDYSRRTYVSENALLPAQVHTYFGGSEHDVFRAYRHEVAGLAGRESEEYASALIRSWTLADAIFDVTVFSMSLQRSWHHKALRWERRDTDTRPLVEQLQVTIPTRFFKVRARMPPSLSCLPPRGGIWMTF